MAEQVGDALESAAEQMGEIAAKRVRRPWLWFFGGSLCLVSLVTAGGPMLTLVSPHPARARTVPLRQLSVAALRDGVGHGQAGVKKMAMPLAVDGRLASSLDSNHKQENHPQKLPSEKPKPGPTLKLESARTVDAPGAADPGGAPRVPERSALIQGMIEAGFSRAQAIEAIAAVNASKSADIPKAISWQLQRDADENLNEWKSERVVLSFDHMDFDGYALLWGNVNKAPSLQECGERCLKWKPVGPSNYPCNIFVYCPLEKCYAPAQLPPGSMAGQCWLKHQDDPVHPQVNMKGNYTAAYLKRHPGAPPGVQWQGGVVVRKDAALQVTTDTWSSRANW
mmetsp:Transcript_7175/g.15868  ORF Transcript_7175/g.15868 Transcript_7175/m.15868 type:complete len:338 (-) Transcript_7175:76-1089(-)